VPKWKEETSSYEFVADKDPETGEYRKGPIGSGNRPFAKELDMQALEDSGYFDERELADIRAGIPGSPEIIYDSGKKWNDTVTKEGYPKGLVSGSAIGGRMSRTTWDALPVKKQEELKQEWVIRQVRDYYSTRKSVSGGALGGGGEISDEEAAQNALRQSST